MIIDGYAGNTIKGQRSSLMGPEFQLSTFEKWLSFQEQNKLWNMTSGWDCVLFHYFKSLGYNVLTVARCLEYTEAQGNCESVLLPTWMIDFQIKAMHKQHKKGLLSTTLELQVLAAEYRLPEITEMENAPVKPDFTVQTFAS